MTELRSKDSNATPAGSSWTLSLALAATFSLLHGRLVSLFGGAGELRSFFDRAIGMTTLAGVDASGYSKAYVRLHLLLAATFLLCFGAALLLRRWLDRSASPQAPEHVWIARLAEIWAAIGIFGALLHGVDLDSLARLLAHLVLLAFGVLVVRSSSTFRRRPWELHQADRHFVVGSLFWPLPCIFAARALLGDQAGFLGAPAGVWGVGFVAIWLAMLALLRHTQESQRLRVMAAAVPWLLVPMTLPAANEFQAVFRSTEPRHVAWILIALLAVASLAVYWWRPLRHHGPHATRNLLHGVYYPLAVASSALFKFHSQKLNLSRLDYFHLGEQLLPTQQLLHFSKLPLIDIRLSHTFSDMVYPWLYAVFHGIQGLDMIVWKACLENVVGVLLCYFVLARVFRPDFALAATLFLPVLSTVDSYYAVALVPALFLARVLQRPTTGRFVALWLSTLALMLWRIDFGLVAFVALTGVLGVFLLRGRHRRRALWYSLAWMTGAVGASLVTLLWVGGPSALGRLAFLLDTYTYRLITRTRPEVIAEYGAAAVAQYYLVPAAGLIYVVYVAAQRLALHRHVLKYKLMLMFVGVFSLVISVRSMERHSLIEGFHPYLAALLVALLPVLLSRTGRPVERHATRAAFAATLVLCSIFSLPPAGTKVGNPRSIVMLQQQPLFRFHRFAEGERRVAFDRRRHRDLLRFLDQVLQPGETFFDFSNAPLLYVLADREFPTYVIPNLVQTSETVQARVLEDLSGSLRAGKMPLVIFKQGNEFWDNTDGVPNEIRSYRVAEWIYRNYRPAVQVGQYQVWWQNDRPAPWDTETTQQEFFLPLRTEALRTAHLYHLTATEVGGSSVQLQGAEFDAQAYRLFDLSAIPPLMTSASWTLDLAVSWSDTREGQEAQAFQLFFGFDQAYFRAESTAWVFPDKVDAEGRVRVDVPWPDGAQRLTDIRVDPRDGSAVTVGDLRLMGQSQVHRALTGRDLQQKFDLDRLPAVWARFDPLEAGTVTPELGTLVDSPIRLETGETLELQLPVPARPRVDIEPATYLHLKVRGEPGGPSDQPDVTLAYGDGAPNTFSFALTTTGGTRYPLSRSTRPGLEGLEPLQLANRWVLRATGPRPVLHHPFDSSQLPQDSRQADLFLRLAYRSRNAGTLSARSASGGRSGDSLSPPTPFQITSDHGKPVILWTQLPPVPPTLPANEAVHGLLSDLALHFSFEPADSGEGPLFEILEAQLVEVSAVWRDYLIRLTTQWQWSQGGVERIEVRAGRPMTIDRVVLRGRD